MSRRRNRPSREAVRWVAEQIDAAIIAKWPDLSHEDVAAEMGVKAATLKRVRYGGYETHDGREYAPEDRTVRTMATHLGLDPQPLIDRLNEPAAPQVDEEVAPDLNDRLVILEALVPQILRQLDRIAASDPQADE